MDEESTSFYGGGVSTYTTFVGISTHMLFLDYFLITVRDTLLGLSPWVCLACMDELASRN